MQEVVSNDTIILVNSRQITESIFTVLIYAFMHKLPTYLSIYLSSNLSDNVSATRLHNKPLNLNLLVRDTRDVPQKNVVKNQFCVSLKTL